MRSEKSEEGNLLPTQKAAPRLYTPAEADVIAKAGRLPDGISLEVEPTWGHSPWSEKGNLRPSWDYLEQIYKDPEDAEAFEAFRKWAGETEIEQGVTVADWIGGESVAADARWPRKQAPEWVDAADVEDWRARLKSRVRNPRGASEVLRWQGKASGPVSRTRVNRAAQSLLDMLPREVSDALPPIQMRVVDTLPDQAFGAYDARTNTLTLAHRVMDGDEMAVRGRVWHEMSHWLHFNADAHPRLRAWRDELDSHWRARTAADTPQDSGVGWSYLPDEWIDPYAGRLYETHEPGVELAAVYLEQVAHGPENVAGWMVKKSWRDTFEVVTSILGGP